MKIGWIISRCLTVHLEKLANYHYVNYTNKQSDSNECPNVGLCVLSFSLTDINKLTTHQPSSPIEWRTLYITTNIIRTLISVPVVKPSP